MAVPKKMVSAQELSEQINDLREKMGYRQEELAESPTSFSYGVSPTRTDLLNEINLRKLGNEKRDLEGQLAQKRWYGEGNAPERTGKRKEGLLEGTLNMLSTPLYGVVGGIEALTGKGTVKGWKNIQKNIEERGTVGDLLRKEGISGGVASAIGFVGDIMIDPVSWATAGTGALLPRVGFGFTKAGLKGGFKGAESGLLQKAATISRFLPGGKSFEGTELSRKKAEELIRGKFRGGVKEESITDGGKVGVRLGEGYEKAQSLYSKGIKGLQDRALRSADEYENLIGRNLQKILEEKSNLATQYLGAGDIIRGVVERMPYGQSLLKAFDYNPREWFKAQMLRDKIEEIEKEKGTFLGEKYDPITNKKIDITEAEKEGVIRGVVAKEIEELENIDNIVPRGSLGKRLDEYPSKKVAEMIDESVEAANAPMNVMRESDVIERYQRMLGEAGEEYEFKNLLKVVKDKISKFESQKTQIEWYDNLRKAISELKTLNGKPYAKKMLDTYDAAIGLFKAVKVSLLSPSAMMNAAVGNLVMSSMAGINILRPELLKTIGASWNYLNGKGTVKWIRDNIETNPLLRPFFASHVNTFGGIIGMTPMDFATKVNVDTIIAKAKAAGQDVSSDYVRDSLMEAHNAIRKTPTEYAREQAARGLFNTEPTTLTAQELGTNEAYLRFKDWAEANASKNPVAKILSVMMNKPVAYYERIDQSYRLGNFLHMVNNGLEKEEIIKLSRFIPIKFEDVSNKYKSGGRYLYRMSPEKALEAVNTIYMNYAAMPGAVKVLRSLPIVGVPFASFGYGMGAKTIETAMYNPAVFNKINLLMNEISGQKTPLEKEAMAKGYYENFGQPGMVKLKFFGENPIYLNVANMLPYLSLNLFAEEGRKYKERFPDKMAETIENMPLLKDPVGQIIFDYFIQPTLIKDIAPQTQFGSPLYPIDASGLQKAGYAGRQLAEAFVPSGPGAIAGTIAGLTPLPEGAIEMTPSYRFRSLARAVRGEDPVTAKWRKEEPVWRWGRGALSTIGLPVSQMNLDYIAKELSKKQK